MLSAVLGLAPVGASAQGTAADAYPPEVLAIGEQALKLAQEGRFSQALPFWERLQQWQSTHLGERDARSIRTLNNLAGIYLGAGFPRKAAEAYRQHLALIEAVHGPRSPETASACLSLAKAERTLAQFDQAEALVRRALTILGGLPGSEARQREQASGHELLGAIAHERGLYPLAEQEHRRALGLRRTVQDPQSLAVANSTANLAQALMRQGRFAQALDLQLQALADYRRRPRLESRGQQSTVLTNIALVQDLLGDRPAALKAMREALPMRLAISGPEHPKTARVLLNLGALEAADGAVAEGLAHYRQGLSVLEQRMGPRHISTAFAVQRMAELARDLGQADNAIGWCQRALSIRREQLRPEHPDIATTLLGLGLAELQLGQPTNAAAQLGEALSIRRKAFGDSHPYTALTSLLLALLRWENGQAGEAADLFQASGAAYARFLQGEAALLPVAERRRLLSTVEESRNVLYGLALQGPQGREIALEARLNLQGLLEELERRQTLLLRGNPDSQRDLAALTSITNQLARMELNDGERQRLQSRRDALERQLFRLLERSGGSRGWVSRQQLAEALPPDGALVEFVRFEPVRFQTGSLRSSGAARYAAIVLLPDNTVTAVDLGAADALNRAIWQALAQTQRVDLEAAAAWERVSRLLIEPLLPTIGAKRQWYVSPDGELHRVPFAALGTSKDWTVQPYGDRHRIRLLTSARDLLAAAPPRSGQGKPLVLADPDFNAQLELGPAAARATNSPPDSDSGGADQWRSLRWSRLPGSRKEGVAVQHLTGGRLFTDASARTLTIHGPSAPRFLPIASHGAFLPKPDQGRPAGTDRLKALEGKGTPGSDPMLRGVVLLAGANRVSRDSRDDGLLSALELSRMNLQGTELVTLSACDTGVGAIELGDGIYGLRRGIAVAGARSSLLSLWKVSDQATDALMQAFYAQLSKGSTPETALRQAQEQLRNHSNRSWQHPYYWASFQLYGRSW
ncbi:MAG: CHAT domain-containing protein [Cyanobium sp.]